MKKGRGTLTASCKGGLGRRTERGFVTMFIAVVMVAAVVVAAIMAVFLAFFPSSSNDILPDSATTRIDEKV